MLKVVRIIELYEIASIQPESGAIPQINRASAPKNLYTSESNEDDKKQKLK